MSHGIIARTDRSIFGRWWWTVDRWSLLALFGLLACGIWLVTAADPVAARRIGVANFHFITRHLLYLLPACAIMLGMSLLNPLQIRRANLAVFCAGLFLLLLTPLYGNEVKGAVRWVSLGPISVQASEIIKPSFAVLSAWLFAKAHAERQFRWHAACGGLFALIGALLITQPDLGQTVVLTGIWGAQVILAGLPLLLLGLLGVLAVAGLYGAYVFLPHVTSRVDRFMSPEKGDTYQVSRSLEAFQSGGWIGTGPGQGTVKMQLPDAHTDFIFAVAGEEMGLIFCLLLVGLFAFIVLRGMSRLEKDHDLFVLLAGTGLLAQFGLQAVINMASALHLMPTKGMTLPFVSFGGSSLLALGYGMGIVLALTRRRALKGDMP